MKDFHFSCGNSTRGAVGLAGSVRARSKAEALRKLRHVLRQHIGPFGEVAIPLPRDFAGYANLYITPENICKFDIDGGEAPAANER